MEIAALALSIIAIGIAMSCAYFVIPKKVNSIYPDIPPTYVNRFTGQEVGKHRVPKK